jgi:hypothetical protein
LCSESRTDGMRLTGSLTRNDLRRWQSSPTSYGTRACVLCANGETEWARTVLADAITFSIDSNAMKLRALEEPELEKLWKNAPEG